ncbi:galactosylceramide sulfotransferase-like [Babylonia areolata]|uniref:galactosylceramide sulfotransferase-like n=1 Tax=Babylonia areolata TaxID=304850 RepID=UPI003FD505D0
MSAGAKKCSLRMQLVKMTSRKLFTATIFLSLLVYIIYIMNFGGVESNTKYFAPEADPYSRHTLQPCSTIHRSDQGETELNKNENGTSVLGSENSSVPRSSKPSSCSSGVDPPSRPDPPNTGQLMAKADGDRQTEVRIPSKTDALSERYPWRINDSSRHPEEVRHVVFVKVHKAASTTLFSVFVKFAIARRLNIMFPKQGHVLSQNEPSLRPVIPHPPSPPFLFDILCNHFVFRHDQIERAFPPDTKYVAILRDPLRRVQSAFYYYTSVFHLRYLKPVRSFKQFIQNQSMFETVSPYISQTNNRMSIDLGLESYYLKDSGYITTFVKRLENKFDLILIADRFDESMLLLKRRLRWTMKDIVYMNLNTHSKKDLSKEKISPETKDKFQRFQRFDVAIYEHFLKKFDQYVAEEGQDFNEELNHYITTLKQINDFCKGRNVSASELVIKPSRWDKQFTLQRSECKILIVEEMKLCAWAKAVQLGRQRHS